MTRLALGIVIGIGVGMIGFAACGLHAQEQPTEDTVAAAEEAGVDPIDLQGAVNTTGLDAHTYLIAVGELAAPISALSEVVNTGWPFQGPLAQRIFCVEAIESAHGRLMYNPAPWQGEHAQGFLGWLPSTARRWGVVIGNRASEWDGARRMLLAGAGSQFFGIAVGRC